MHQNGIVLAIKNAEGKVLRESTGVVHLPLHSEYSLLIKNLNPFRVCVDVQIDGTDVLGFNSLVISANSSTTLERFMVDGNTKTGNQFKFVPLSDSGVQDPSSPANGVVTVTAYREDIPFYAHPIHIVDTKPYWFGSGVVTNNSVQTLSVNNTQMFNCCTTATQSDIGSVAYSATINHSAAGATVEGRTSNQKFTHTSFVKGPWLTAISLRLMDSTHAVTVQDKKFCAACGFKTTPAAKFCSRCGKPV